MNKSNLLRRDFLKASTLAGVGASFAGIFTAVPALGPSTVIASLRDISLTRPRLAGQKLARDFTTKPLARVRVIIPDFTRGLWKMMQSLGIVEKV
jgi:hypothetical protein